MMISTPSVDARGHFPTAVGLPPEGSRIWITGFPRQVHDDVAELVKRRGYEPTAFAQGADAVLVRAPTQAILDEAKRSVKRVLLVDQFRSSAESMRRRTAVEVGEESVRILDICLPRNREPLADAAGERFAHLCLDSLFLKVARTVALAAETGMPCGLEGPTAVAKTTAVLWVGQLCRQEVVRLNMNGQSDTGELVGRFLPAAGGKSNWRFSEGVIPAAMRHGRWVVLDEINLAEPQILERLNPVLEQPATLVLSENDGLTYGPAGDIPVGENFRLFATMNPAEYAGRSVLSPAFRDRWNLWALLEPPSEQDFKALLVRLVYGVQPEFIFHEVIWQADDATPVHPHLAEERSIDRVLTALAAFHTSMTSAAGAEGSAQLGSCRRERYVFTRRTLLTAMSLLAMRVASGETLERAVTTAVELAYLSRLAPGPDRNTALASLRCVDLA